MEISVVVPVRNEEKTIHNLLDGLLGQTRMPNEILITDGGSTDKTPEIIEEYSRRGFPVRLIRDKAALPGRGRNLAAAQANCEWLAFIDAGIRPSADWLAGLAQRAEAEDADVVYGAWEPAIDSFFKECAAIAYVSPPAKIGDSLMRPRSIASTLMRRDVWEFVGGFPEHLRSAEDLLFMNKVAETHFLTVYAPNAKVRWSLQPTLGLTFKRFVSYARNNIRAGLWSSWQAAIFKRYGLLLVSTLPAFFLGPRWLLLMPMLWLLMMVARGLVAIWRNRNCYPASLGRNIFRLGLLVPLLTVVDAAALIGSLQWFFKDRVDPTMGVTDGA
ncbi:MAG: glycosyltransferase [Pyrinomonadaceae bacterium]|nr:glycosyltransferase [Pyrinomonadaceae bacterium]